MTRHYVTTQAVKGLPQFILAIDREYYDQDLCHAGGKIESIYANPINHVPHEHFLQRAQSYLTIREREYLDESLSYDGGPDTDWKFIKNAKGENKKGDPRYKQLLPYMIARQLQEDGTYLYFPYRRTKKVGESRLAGNGSLGYGGHIDLEDIVSDKSVIDLKATILKSALREAIEEFTLSHEVFGSHEVKASVYKDAISFGDLFIVDNSNDVGELHLGIIMYFDVPLGWTLEASEDELAKLPPMTANQMLIDPDFNAENWTRIYLDHYYNLPQFEEGNGGDDPGAEFDIDESGLERELVDRDSEDDIPGSGADEVLAIDHGGEKVGEVDASLLQEIVIEQDPETKATIIKQGGVAVTHVSNISFPGMTPMPNPTEDDLKDPVFNAIYQTAKNWDVNVPDSYNGYCGFNGSHAKIILDAVRGVDQSYFTNVAVPGYGRTHIHVDVAEGEDPLKAIAEAFNKAHYDTFANGTSPQGVISTIPNDMIKTFQETGKLPEYANNINWNNTITGSPENAIDLNITELQAGQAITNAVDIPVKSSTEE